MNPVNLGHLFGKVEGMFCVTNNVAQWLVQTSWQASILILLVGAVLLLLRNQIPARWRYIIWLLVAVRLLLPVVPASSFSIFNFIHIREVDKLVESLQPPPEMPVSVEGTFNSIITSDHPWRMDPSVGVAVVDHDEKRHVSNKVPLIVVGVWIFGMLVSGLHVFRQDWLFAWRLRGKRMVTDTRLLDILEECRNKLNIGFPIPLLETASVDTPALYGVLHPRLLIPEGILQTFTIQELQHIFMHELAHVKRRDLVTHWLLTFVQVVHWFNPLVWLALRRMHGDRELACDALALSHNRNQHENESYGQTLIKLLERFVRPVPTPGVVGMLEKNGLMKERITMIARFENRSGGRFLAVVLLVLLGVAGFTDARATLNPRQTFPPGLVAWWREEGDANDAAGSNDGELDGRVAFVKGASGKAIYFNGVDTHIKVAASPTLDVGEKSGLTIAAWINPDEILVERPIVEWNSGKFGVHLWISSNLSGGPGSLYASIKDVALNRNPISSSPGLVKAHKNQHVAVTYDKASGMAVLYLDGNVIANTYLGNFTPMTYSDVYIGLRPADGGAGTRFIGWIDEVQIYDRALSPRELESVYHSTSGKSLTGILASW